METCSLFNALYKMPKGAIHHLHTTAANPINAYLQLTYDDRVYYNNKDKLFKVFPLHEGVPEGYIQCKTLREFHPEGEFDKIVTDEILLRDDQAKGIESHAIWFFFEKKFSKVGELGKFVPFFK